MTEEGDSIGCCQEKFKKNRNHRTTFCVIMISSEMTKRWYHVFISTQKNVLHLQGVLFV